MLTVDAVVVVVAVELGLGRARRGPVGQQLHGHRVHRRGDLVVEALVLGMGVEGVGGEAEDGQADRQQHHQRQHQAQAQRHRRTPIDGELAGRGMDLDRGSREPLRAGIMPRRPVRPGRHPPAGRVRRPPRLGRGWRARNSTRSSSTYCTTHRVAKVATLAASLATVRPVVPRLASVAPRAARLTASVDRARPVKDRTQNGPISVMTLTPSGATPHPAAIELEGRHGAHAGGHHVGPSRRHGARGHQGAEDGHAGGGGDHRRRGVAGQLARQGWTGECHGSRHTGERR